MGGGLESRCVGRVYGADGAVRRTKTLEVFHVCLVIKNTVFAKDKQECR